MTTEPRGNHKRGHKAGHSLQSLQRLDAVGDSPLLGVLQGKAVCRLKNALQHTPQGKCRMRGIGELLQCLREFGNRRHPHLVEIEVVLTQLCKRFLGGFIASVF